MTTLDDVRRQRVRVMHRECRRRNRDRELAGLPTGLIDAAPVQDAALALHELGWSASAIVHLNGAGTQEGLSQILRGVSARVERKWEPILTLPVTCAVPVTMPDTVFVPSLGATRRVQALLALGWPLKTQTAEAGRELQHVSRGGHPKLSAADWRRIDAMYERLSAHPGPSKRTRDRARARGIAPPLAWDDIDDPAERPKITRGSAVDYDRHADVDDAVVERVIAGEWHLPTTPAERRVVVGRWVHARRSLTELERATGWRAHRYLLDEEAS